MSRPLIGRRRGRCSAVLLCLVAGCSNLGTNLVQLSVEPAGSSAAPDVASFAGFLKQAVVEGRVDYRAIEEDPSRLDRFLASLAEAGPESTPPRFPGSAERLAYWLNAHNAAIVRAAWEDLRCQLAMRSTILLPQRLERDPLTEFTFMIDGRELRPADLRAAALHEAGRDWRARFALCDARRGGPPMPARVFLPDVLPGQLNECVRSALRQPQIVLIDHGMQELRVWRGLADIRGPLTADLARRVGEADVTLINVLLEWSTPEQRRELNTAIGYDLAVLPYDGRVNHYSRR